MGCSFWPGFDNLGQIIMVGAKLGVLYGVPRDAKFLCKPRKWAGQREQKRGCFDLLTRWLHFLGSVGSMPERKNYYCWVTPAVVGELW